MLKACGNFRSISKDTAYNNQFLYFFGPFCPDFCPSRFFYSIPALGIIKNFALLTGNPEFRSLGEQGMLSIEWLNYKCFGMLEFLAFRRSTRLLVAELLAIVISAQESSKAFLTENILIFQGKSFRHNCMHF
jgi:hypothetical protein